MKRKMLSLFLIVTMSVSILGGCGNIDETSDTAGTAVTSKDTAETQDTQAVSNAGDINFDEDPYTLNVPVITYGEIPADLQLVQDEINKHILDKINVQVELEPVNAFNLSNVYTLKASSNEKLDLISMAPLSTMFMPLVTSNMVMPLDDLVAEWGQDVSADLGDVINVGMLNDNLYILPAYGGTYAVGSRLLFNAELVKKYDLEDEIRNVKTVSDIEPMLALIKENEPSVIPYSSENPVMGYTNLMGGTLVDGLGTNYGGINLKSDDVYEVVNTYESEEFMSKCKLMREWYVKGYISKDTLTSQEIGGDMAQAGKVFCMISVNEPTNGDTLDNPRDDVMVSWPLEAYQGVVTTTTFSYGWAISSSCERPDKAMQFLNLLYTDSTLVTLLQRGIEGRHYTLTADNCVEVDVEGGYYIMLPQFGDTRLVAPLVEHGADYHERIKLAEQEAIISPAFGFRFDSSDYDNALAACEAVSAEYFNVIDCGAVDPEEEIPKFLEKLKAAGIDTLIAAKQEQLDAWVAANGK